MFRFKKKGASGCREYWYPAYTEKGKIRPTHQLCLFFSFSLQGSFVFFLLIADANEEPTELLEVYIHFAKNAPSLRWMVIHVWSTRAFDYNPYIIIVWLYVSFRFVLFSLFILQFEKNKVKKTNKTNAFQNKNGGRWITWKRLSRLSSFVVHIQVGKVKVGDDHQRADACKRGQGRKEVFIFKKK